VANTHSELPKHILNTIRESKNTIRLTPAKCILLGPMSVGKSSIFTRCVQPQGDFGETYKPTIGLDFQTTSATVFGAPFEMSLWDTAGQESFSSVTKTYYRGSDAILLVFDLNDDHTIKDLPKWYSEVVAHAPEDVLIFIVGNKSDLPKLVLQDDIMDLRRSIRKAEYWECSAKYNQNVIELMKRVTMLCFERRIEQYLKSKDDEERNIKLNIYQIHQQNKEDSGESSKRRCC